MERIERVIVVQGWVWWPGWLIGGGLAAPWLSGGYREPTLGLLIGALACVLVRVLVIRLWHLDMRIGCDGVLLTGRWRPARYVAFADVTNAGYLDEQLWIRTQGAEDIRLFVVSDGASVRKLVSMGMEGRRRLATAMGSRLEKGATDARERLRTTEARHLFAQVCSSRLLESGANGGYRDVTLPTDVLQAIVVDQFQLEEARIASARALAARGELDAAFVAAVVMSAVSPGICALASVARATRGESTETATST